MNKKLKRVIFIIIAIVLFDVISKFFTPHHSNYFNYEGFYKEEINMDDVVVIGASNAYAFLCPPLMYEMQGIAAYDFSTDSMPFEIVEEVMREAVKRQPEATFVVALSDVDKAMNEQRMHWTLDYMKFGLNKISAVKKCLTRMGKGISQSGEFFFPIIRYHSGWDDVDASFFEYDMKDTKGALIGSKVLSKCVDVNSQYIFNEECEEISSYGLWCLENLLKYIEANNVTVIFVIVPQADMGEHLGRINMMKSIISEHGCEILDLRELTDVTGIDFQHDYYDAHHVNSHGTIKTSNYMAKYLIERNYAIDRRGDKRYNSWLTANREYHSIVDSSVLDYEWDIDHRDYSLQAPHLAFEVDNNGVYLNWDVIRNADGYALYKKSDNGRFQFLTVTNETAYFDELLEDVVVQYVVVPISIVEGERYYGNCDYNGVSVEITKDSE